MSKSKGGSARALAELSVISECGSHEAMVRSGVDTRAIMRGTRYDATTMKSKSALMRGNIFEQRMADNGYAGFVDAVREETGIDLGKAKVVMLDDNTKSEQVLLQETTRRIEKALKSGKSAVLAEARVFSKSGSILKADFLLICDGVITVAEAKSWPVIDGTAVSSSLLSKALDQAALYVVNLQETFGHDHVSREAIIINPRNVGYEPKFTMTNVEARLLKARDVLRRAAEAGTLDPDPLLEGIDDPKTKKSQRIKMAADMIERHGAVFDPRRCSTGCGLVKACHERAYMTGSLAVIGEQSNPLLSGIHSLRRVAELAEGDQPDDTEALAAAEIRYAAQSIATARGGRR